MPGLILRRLLLGLVTLFAVILIMFTAVEVLPGDSCTAYLGRTATPTALANCRAEIGMDRPVAVRFFTWIGDAVRGDLGVSLAREKPVVEVIALRLRNTAVLAFSATLLGFPIAILFGVLTALRRDTGLDVAVSTAALLAMSIPEFVSATALVLVFSVWLHWLPGINVVPPDAPLGRLLASIVTPTIALALVTIAHVLRMVRTSVIEVMQSPFAQMAILRGVPYWRMVFRHVLPNALLPTISLMALQIAWLLGGVVVIEVVFNYPGLGRLTVDAISDRDLPLVLGIAVLLALIYVAINLIADILILFANPRLRTART